MNQMKTSRNLWSIAGIVAAVAAVAVPAYAAYGGAAVPTGVYAGWSNGTVAIGGLPTTCSGGTSGYYYFYTANADTTKVLHLATAAMLAGKKINCNILSCDSSGNTNGERCKLEP
jgi:hypothetical protein